MYTHHTTQLGVYTHLPHTHTDNHTWWCAQPSALSTVVVCTALSPQPSVLWWCAQPSALSRQPSVLWWCAQPSALSPQCCGRVVACTALSPQPSAVSPQPSVLWWRAQPSALSRQPSALSPQYCGGVHSPQWCGGVHSPQPSVLWCCAVLCVQVIPH